MRDVDLYTRILGIQALWQVTDVEVDMPQGQVTVHVEREAGAKLCARPVVNQRRATTRDVAAGAIWIRVSTRQSRKPTYRE